MLEFFLEEEIDPRATGAWILELEVGRTLCFQSRHSLLSSVIVNWYRSALHENPQRA